MFRETCKLTFVDFHTHPGRSLTNLRLAKKHHISLRILSLYILPSRPRDTFFWFRLVPLRIPTERYTLHAQRQGTLRSQCNIIRGIKLYLSVYTVTPDVGKKGTPHARPSIRAREEAHLLTFWLFVSWIQYVSHSHPDGNHPHGSKWRCGKEVPRRPAAMPRAG